MRLLLATIAVAALGSAFAHAGEIILVDPISGTTRAVSGERVLAPDEKQTDVQRARERIQAPQTTSQHKVQQGDVERDENQAVNPTDHMAPDGSSSIVILPHAPDPLTSGRNGRKATSGEAARRASDRAGSYVLEDGEVQTGVDRKSIIIIEDGKAKVIREGERVDNKTRNKVDILKARAYRQKDKPCGGSVIVGGIGETGTPTSSGTSYSDDVTVISNCR